MTVEGLCTCCERYKEPDSANRRAQRVRARSADTCHPKQYAARSTRQPQLRAYGLRPQDRGGHRQPGRRLPDHYPRRERLDCRPSSPPRSRQAARGWALRICNTAR